MTILGASEVADHEYKVISRIKFWCDLLMGFKEKIENVSRQIDLRSRIGKIKICRLNSGNGFCSVGSFFYRGRIV